jgi:hypothetical protein
MSLHQAYRAAPSEEAALHDLRFRTLVGAEAWQRLPLAIRQRFSQHLGPGCVVTYTGEVIASRQNLFGRLLAQAARLIGAPLPLSTSTGQPASVSVMADAPAGGQFWTRIYGRPGGFPQVIQSSKRFTGPTGLEEYLGFGLSIALAVSATADAIHFRSAHYLFSLGRLKCRLPAPGTLTISHVAAGQGTFQFILSLHHPWFGELIHQTCRFYDRI